MLIRIKTGKSVVAVLGWGRGTAPSFQPPLTFVATYELLHSEVKSSYKCVRHRPTVNALAQPFTY